jgi:hypothetical protein
MNTVRRFIEHIKDTRAPHERRLHAMQISGVITAALFVVWAGTLGLRLASPGGGQSADTTLSASAAAAAGGQTAAHLEVATSSAYSQ